MLPSGNDAAIALAEYFGNVLSKNQDPEKFCSSSLAIRFFIDEMNSKAKDLKLTGTNFANPHGLSNSKNMQFNNRFN